MAALKKLKLGVQISGRGSNLQSLIDACASPDFPAEIVLVISNVADAYGLERAKAAGIPTRVIPHTDFPKNRQAFEEKLDEAHTNAGVDLICNAGFMRILSPYLVRKWEGRMINIHPSLLPAFPGLHTHQKAIDGGVKFSGCTIHFVNEETDGGAILVQAAVPVFPTDDADQLAERVLGFEHVAYPMAVRLIAEGKARYENGRVIWENTDSARAAGILNPPAKY
jgi:phosphoribosylglycinamide formyltransferase-1